MNLHEKRCCTKRYFIAKIVDYQQDLPKQYNRDKFILSVEKCTSIFEVFGCKKGVTTDEQT